MLQSRIAVSSAPLWLRNATLPALGARLANVASKPITGFMIPRQLGPITRMEPDPRCNCSRILCSSAVPSAPRSRNPAEITTAAFTPASTHSPIKPGTVVAGVTTMARSTSAGTSPMLGNARTPHTSLCLGLTAYTLSENAPCERFISTVRPTLPAFSVAPITATFFGKKKASRAFRALEVSVDICRTLVMVPNATNCSLADDQPPMVFIGSQHNDHRSPRVPLTRRLIKNCSAKPWVPASRSPLTIGEGHLKRL